MELWSYFDSFQSVFFNQKQRDRGTAVLPLGVIAGVAGLLLLWAVKGRSHRARQLKHVTFRRAA